MISLARSLTALAVIAAALCLLSPVDGNAQGTGAAIDIGLTAEERAWIASNPEVSVAYDPFYAPYSFIGTKGAITGLAPELFTRIAELTGLKFSAAPVRDWQDILDKARARKIDVVATIVETEERGKFLSFTTAFLPTPLVIMARTGDYGILGPDTLSGKTVALVRGYSSTDRVLYDHPDIITRYVDSPLEALQDVSVGRADAYVGVVGVNAYLARHHGLANLRIASEYELESSIQGFGVRPDRPLLRSILQKAIESFGDIEQTEAYRRWVPLLQTVVEETSSTPFELTQGEEQWLRDHGPIRIGTNVNWAPMDYTDANGTPEGIGAGFIRAVDRRLGGVIEIVPGPWPEIYAAAEAGELDGVAGISPTAERERIFRFTEPYIRIPHVIFAPVDMQRLPSLDALWDKRVAIEEGFFLGKLIERRFPKAEILRYGSTNEALTAVSKGEADAYVGNRAVANYAIHALLIGNLKEHGTISETSSVNAFGFPRQNEKLRDIFQKALDSITVRERRSISGAWVAPEREQVPFTLTPAEREWLLRHPTIRVAGDREYAPIEFIGEDGTYQGLAPDYLRKLSELLDVNFVYDTKSDWDEALRKLENRELDIASAAAATDSRRRYADFTAPYLRLPVMIFGRRGGFFAADLGDLENRTVAVVRGYAATEYLLEQHPEISFVPVSTVAAGAELLLSGHVDAYVGSILTTSHAIREDGMNALMVTGKTPFSVNLSIAVRKDWPIFTNILRRAINHLSSAERTAIVNKWIGLRIKEPLDFRLMLQISLAAFIVLALAAAGIWTLWRRTRAQAAELVQRNEALAEESRSRLAAQHIAERTNLEKDHLLANVSHELRTPLNAIVGYTELLFAKFAKEPTGGKISEYLSALKMAGGQLQTIVQDLLEMTVKPGDVELREESVPLDKLFSNVKSLLDVADGPDSPIVSWPDPLPFVVTGDMQRLSQVLLNLLGNALKFSPPGSEITVSTQLQSDGDLEIRVKDRGIGIAPELLDEVMAPFVRGEDPFVRASQGSGLGLSISKSFIEAHGGALGLESMKGRGTTAVIRLPKSRVARIAA
ncbi:transporter substrate-binding domain-containing protein [Nisaea acidiphila]|uniref:histidine kinase n=1 Tax=Nisaea acidiphila TaxID=1862145 RepID=A0A9J7AY85_9PROT|nr:transporter substrate-binding domain-containing protein [Nisaea acidiphila]UUX51393.1 transporter substrate-binding domain-containing protein [Nisaea acidiphila]